MLHRYKASHLAAVAVIVGSLATMSPAFAADTPAKSMHKHHHMLPEEMHKHVEERISMLHSKLKITPEQETAWGKVAMEMRETEKKISDLISERHANALTMTAIEDLKSYQKIAAAHAHGLEEMIEAFDELYESMPADQKANADKVFGGFEGHEHGMQGENQGHSTMQPVGK